MATDADLLAQAKKIDAERKRKTPNPSRKKKKGKGKQKKPSVAKCAPRKEMPKNYTIVLPVGAHLAMVGTTFRVEGNTKKKPPSAGASKKPKPRKKTTKRKRRKTTTDE